MSRTVPANLETWARPRRKRLEDFLLSRFADAWPPRLAEGCVYPIRTGGKRIRPLFAWAAAEAVLGDGVEIPGILGAAGAVELVHSYSLVHDDLPAMDDDDERRGQPTVHKVFGEDGAILVGDALLTEAFGLLASLEIPASTRIELVAELAKAAGHVGMIAGQGADIGMGGPVADLDALVRLHRGKTGALIRGAVRMGALAAGAGPAQMGSLTTYAEAIGLAFQMADDILDEEQDAGEDGPPSYVKLLGADETRRRAQALADEAHSAIDALPHPAMLHALATFTVERDT